MFMLCLKIINREKKLQKTWVWNYGLSYFFPVDRIECANIFMQSRSNEISGLLRELWDPKDLRKYMLSGLLRLGKTLQIYSTSNLDKNKR